jgi:hypothetical protein
MTEALSRWSKAWNVFRTHETSIALTLLYSDQVSSGAEVRDDNQADSSFEPNVRYSYLSYMSRPG